MKRSGRYKFPCHLVDASIKRHLADPLGFPVRSEAPKLGMSVPGYYIRLRAHKKALMDGVPSQKTEQLTKDIEITTLKQEVARLQRKLFDEMLASGRL